MKINENASIMAEAARFIFAFLGQPRNAPLTASMLLLCFMAWWNIHQNTSHIVERQELNRAMFKKDSVSRVEREEHVGRIIELRRDILQCKTDMERVMQEIIDLKKQRKR